MIMNSTFINSSQAKEILNLESSSLNKAILKYCKNDSDELFYKAKEIINYNIDYKVDIFSIEDLEIYLELFKKFKVNNDCSIYLNFLEILDYNEIYNIIRNYNNQPFLNQLMIDVDEQFEYLNFYDYSRFINKYNEIICSIPKSDSQLEIIIHAYNEVKKYKYKETPDETKSIKAKSLGSVLLSRDDEGPIVCVGYVKLFNMILRSFGIKCTNYDYYYIESMKQLGHQISIVNISDDIYDVHGIYFFDPSGDSKINDNDNYINKYKYFLQSFSDIEKLDIIYDISNGYFKKGNYLINHDIDKYSNKKENLPKEAKDICNYMKKVDRDLFDGKYNIYNTDDITYEYCKTLSFISEMKKDFLYKNIDINLFLHLLIKTFPNKEYDDKILRNYLINSLLSKYGSSECISVLPKIEAKVKSFR